jgi:hypothetical protein
VVADFTNGVLSAVTWVPAFTVDASQVVRALGIRLAAFFNHRFNCMKKNKHSCNISQLQQYYDVCMIYDIMIK